jgi:hypothetical protein
VKKKLQGKTICKKVQNAEKLKFRIVFASYFLPEHFLSQFFELIVLSIAIDPRLNPIEIPK